MSTAVVSADPAAIALLRRAHHTRLGVQIVRHSWLDRGFASAWLIYRNSATDRAGVGYAIVGGAPGEPRDAVIEFFVESGDRAAALLSVIAQTGARRVETQSNDCFLFPILAALGIQTEATHYLFEDGASHDARPGDAPNALGDQPVVFRAVRDGESVFEHRAEPVGPWCIEAHGVVVATGGWFTHYNPPFADLYMEVHPEFRRRGIGTRLVRALRSACRERGLRPAARCDRANTASLATLERAGLTLCGELRRGTIHLA